MFRHLVNKVPLNRIVELCGVSFPTLYDKIWFIHRQCSMFAAARETRLSTMDLGRRYLSTDRQDYIVNWGNRTNRKTIQLTAVATADRESGYLFAFSPNFDASLDQDQAEAAWLTAGDGATLASRWTRHRKRRLARSTAEAQSARGTPAELLESLGGMPGIGRTTLGRTDQRRGREERRGLAPEFLVNSPVGLDATLHAAIATVEAGVSSDAHDSVAVGPTLSA